MSLGNTNIKYKEIHVTLASCIHSAGIFKSSNIKRSFSTFWWSADKQQWRQRRPRTAFSRLAILDEKKIDTLFPITTHDFTILHLQSNVRNKCTGCPNLITTDTICRRQGFECSEFIFCSGMTLKHLKVSFWENEGYLLKMLPRTKSWEN